MSSPLQQINKLINCLPAKDLTHAKKFIEKKDWESLKDLTWSCLQLIETAYEKGEISPKYQNIDLDKVRELALVCDEYYYLIYPEEEEIEVDYDYDDVLEEDI